MKIRHWIFFLPNSSRHRFSDPFYSILEIKLDRSNIRHGWTVVTGLRSRFLFYPTFEIPLSLTLFSSLASKRHQIGNTGPDGSGSATPCRAIVEWCVMILQYTRIAGAILTMELRHIYTLQGYRVQWCIFCTLSISAGKLQLWNILNCCANNCENVYRSKKC